MEPSDHLLILSSIIPSMIIPTTKSMKPSDLISSDLSAQQIEDIYFSAHRFKIDRYDVEILIQRTAEINRLKNAGVTLAMFKSFILEMDLLKDRDEAFCRRLIAASDLIDALHNQEKYGIPFQGSDLQRRSPGMSREDLRIQAHEEYDSMKKQREIIHARLKEIRNALGCA